MRALGKALIAVAAVAAGAAAVAWLARSAPAAPAFGGLARAALANPLVVAAGSALVLLAAAAGAISLLGRRRRAPEAASGAAPLSPLAPATREVAGEVRERIALLGRAIADRADDMIGLTDAMLRGAVHAGASDVHIHPVEAGTQVAFRVHGVIEPVVTLARELHEPLIRRIKVLARLVLYRRDRPQDGHFALATEHGPVDVRVSLLPTNHGEKAVLRIARAGVELPDLGALGLPPALLPDFRAMLDRPQGLLFLTGPTGSGKTTTIYASLAHIHRTRGETTHIATIEDPIEFDLPFLSQTQVRGDVGLTFAQGLRSILRQDPNVMMVGEIRDAETAHIAVQAGLTGHLILTTVHASSAAGVFNRLIEMGVEPFLLASASIAALSQRLVRDLCPHCRAAAAPAPAEAAWLAGASAGAATGAGASGAFYRAAGCARCNGTGYLGRRAIFEMLPVTGAVRDLVTQKVPTARVHEAAVAEGMVPLVEAGLARARAGDTTLAEVIRVAS